MQNEKSNFSEGVNDLLSHLSKKKINWTIVSNRILIIELDEIGKFGCKYSKDLKPYSRQELIEMRTIFENLANINGINDTWHRAYINAADAIDRLDAMISRTEIPSSDIKFSNDENL